MAKQCKDPECTLFQFGGGYCYIHQWMRTDKQKKPPKPRSPIKRMSATKRAEKIAQAKEDNEFYLSLWMRRKHECAYCGDPLGDEPRKYMFDHVLEKSKFPYLRHQGRNIVLTCMDCHSVKTSQRYTQNMKIIIYGAAMFFLRTGDLIQVGNVNIDRLHDWVAENSIEFHKARRKP